MENFEFVSPTHFVFGRGAEEQVGEKLAAAGAKRVLVHFGGGSAVASGLIDRVGASLDAAGIEHLELGGVRPNPEITLVREGVRLCKEANVDWVLAVGGGSVIDSAKAIANGACVEGDVWELFETKALDHDVLPIAVVLGVPMDAMLAYGIVVAGLFVSMACATMFSIQAISFVQLETPGFLVGKVIALTMSLANCAQPVGQLIYGGLFDALRGNLVPVALGTAAVAFVIGLVTFRVLKKGLAELQAAVPGAADAR